MSGLDHEVATRRRVLQVGLAVVGGVAATGSARAAGNDSAPPGQPAPAKYTPEAVHYRATPNGGMKCLYCTYFTPPETCAILSAPVSRDGWCDHFVLAHE
jgi:hypothetical protein